MMTAKCGAGLLGLTLAVFGAAGPALAQSASHIVCTAWGSERRHFYSDAFAGKCEPAVFRQGGQLIRLEQNCREGTPPVSQFRAHLAQTYGEDAIDLVECYRDAPAASRKFLEAEQRKDKAGGDNPVLTGWRPG